MDMHNIDEYLDLSQDSTTNLVDDETENSNDVPNTADENKDLDWGANANNADNGSTNLTPDLTSTTPQTVEAANNMLSTSDNIDTSQDDAMSSAAAAAAAAAAAVAVASNTQWFTGLQGIDFSQIINNNGMMVPPVTITPDSLTRPPPPPTAAQIQQQLQAAQSLMTAASNSASTQQQEQQNVQEKSPSPAEKQPVLSLKESIECIADANIPASKDTNGFPTSMSPALDVGSTNGKSAVRETSTVSITKNTSTADEDTEENKKANEAPSLPEKEVDDVDASTTGSQEPAGSFATVSNIKPAEKEKETAAGTVCPSDETVAAPSPDTSQASIASSSNKKSAAKKGTASGKKRKSRKKLYCICQKPYDGEPMVQCDKCKQWFHCECVGFDPEDTDVEDDAEWICKTCIEDNKKEQESLSTDSQQNSITNVNMTATANASPTISAPIPTLVNPTTTSISTTRQSRSGRSQSKCLYAGCQNRTRADSFCSDVCARKHNEDLNSTTRNMRRHSSAANRIHAMTGVTPSTAVSSGQTTNSSTTKGTEAIIKSTGMDIDTDNANVVDDNEDDVAIDQDDEKDEDVKMEDIIEEEDDGDDSLNEEDEEDEEDEFEFKAKPVSTSPKTTHSKNRRKSSATKTKASLEGGKAPSAKSPSEKEKVASSSATQTPSQSASPEENPIRRNVIKSMTNVLKPIFDAALEKNPGMLVTPPPTATTSTAAENADGESKSSELSQNRAEQLARSIESAMLEQLGESKGGHKVPGDQYKSKFRSLLHNLKDKANQVFQLRVITGDLTPVELTGMSSEDMANPELKSKDEDMRKKSLKNSVMKIENMPIIKKTHKGDIIMLPNMDHQETEESMYSKEVQDELLRISNASRATTTTTTTGATDDDGGRSGSGTPISSRSRSASYSQTPTPSDEKRFSFGAAGAKVDPLNNILSRLGAANSSGSDSDGPSSTSGNATNKRSNSLLTPSTEEDMEAKKRKLNEDLEKMLGEDDETPFMVEDVVPEDTTESEEIKNVSEPVQQQLSSTIWKGRVNMPQVAEFEASARQIGGRILNEEEWQEVLSPNMWIEGRIRTESVTDYVTQTQYSNSREIVLIEVEAEGGDDNQEAQSLLHYLESRKRYAVVGHNKTRIKDFYLIPLYKTQEIPDCLYVVRVEDRKKRPVDVFLGVLVLTKQKLQPHHGPSDGTITAEPTAMDASRSLPIAVSEASTSLPTVETTATVPPILPPELQFLQHLPQLAQLASQQQQSHQSQPYQASYSSYQAAVAPVSQQAYQPSYGYQAAPIAGSSSINTGSGYQQNYNHSHRPQQRNQRQRSNNNNRRHHYNNNVNSNGNSYHPSYRK